MARNKISQFLLANNPMHNEDDFFVIHTGSPCLIIRPFAEGEFNEIEYIKHIGFRFTYHPEGCEYYLFIEKLNGKSITTDDITDADWEKIKQILSKAARWYYSLLKSEDDGAELEDLGRLN